MKYGEVVMELVKLAAERVELLHPGLGIHCMAMSLRFAGLTKVATNIKEEGARQYGNNLEKCVSAGDKALQVVSTEQAMANEFRVFVLKDAGKARVEALCRQLNAGPISNRKVAELRKSVAEKLSKLPAPRVMNLLTSAEHRICDGNISSRKVDKVVLSDNRVVDIQKVCRDSQYKLTGGEASLLCLEGGRDCVSPHECLRSQPEVKKQRSFKCSFE
jgi:hypothetical protein